jgi:hypothetical protein
MMKPMLKWVEKLINFEYLHNSPAGDKFEVRYSRKVDGSGDEWKTGTNLYLGRYSINAILKVLRREGIAEHIRKLGLTNIVVSMNTSDPYHQTLFFHHELEDPAHLIGEIKISRGIFNPRKDFIPEPALRNLEMLIIEWIALQNPFAQFTAQRPRLPGQEHPGLGMGKKVGVMLGNVAAEMKKDGVLNFPEYYHNALFYSLIYIFYNPFMQGKLLAMERDLKAHPIHRVSDAILRGCLVDRNTGIYILWSPGFPQDKGLFQLEKLQGNRQERVRRQLLRD